MWQFQGSAYTEHCILDGIPESECSLAKKLFADYRGASRFWLIVMSVLFMISNLLRALRWHMMLKPLGYKMTTYNSFFAIMTAYFANLGVPRIGEFVRAGIITKYEKIPFEKVFGTIVVDRIVDMLSLLILLLLGLLFRFDKIWNYFVENLKLSPVWLGTILLLGTCAMILLVLFTRKYNYTVNEENHPFRNKVNKTLKGFAEGIGTIKRIPRLPIFILYSIGIWGLYYLMHYLAFFAYEPTSHLGPADALMVFDFGSLGIVFPSPGGMGSYHALVVEALKILGISPINGFSFAMITFFTINIFCNVGFGLLSLILLPILNRKKVDSLHIDK